MKKGILLHLQVFNKTTKVKTNHVISTILNTYVIDQRDLNNVKIGFIEQMKLSEMNMSELGIKVQIRKK